MAEIMAISASQLDRMLADPSANLELIDVREAWEFELGHIAQSAHFALSQFETTFQHIPKSKNLVLICHHGVRSMMACEFLKHQGYENLYNLTGGTDAWSIAIDSNLPRY